MSSNSTIKEAVIREPTIEEAVKSLLFDEDLSDIRIQCSDGTILPANRAILASRSDVFKKMLFGHFFQEACDKVIRVDYNGVVVQAILEFMYTNDAPVLSILLEDETANFVEDILPGSVDTLVSVAAAADCFHLPSLYQKVCQLMQDHPDLTCLFFDASLAQGLLSSEGNDEQSLSNLALQTLWSNPSILLESQYLGLMSPLALNHFLKGNEIVASELELFGMLVKWADFDNHNDNKGLCSPTISAAKHLENQPPPSSPTGVMDLEFELESLRKELCTTNEEEDQPPINVEESSRRDLARKLTQYIQLHHIPPHQLAEEVTASGLVTKDQLLEAYKEQAMQAAATDCNVLDRFPKRRGCFTWKYTQSTVWSPISSKLETKVLDCPVMKSGSSSSYKWTLHIESNCADAWLGMIACTDAHPPSPSQHLGKQQGEWVDGSYGFGCHDFEGSDGQMKYPGFQQGDTVTFSFSTTSSANNEELRRGSFLFALTPSREENGGGELKKGTLSVSVNDGPSVKQFVDMPKKDEGNTSGAGFLPAVSLKSPGSVRLVKFEKIL